MGFAQITEYRQYQKDWKEHYQRRMVSAEEAAKAIKSGDLVAHPFAGPDKVLLALAKRKDELRNIYLELNAPSVDPGWFQEGWEESFIPVGIHFLGGLGRPVHDAKRCSFMPCLMSMRSKLHDEGRRAIDVFITDVSPPDEHGFCSFGPHLWNKRSYATRARVVIGEVDKNMVYPFYGNNFIHVSEVNYFVESPSPRFSDEEIKNFVRKEVKDQKSHQKWLDTLTLLSKWEPNYLGKALTRMGPFIDAIQPEFFSAVLGLEEPYPEAYDMAGYVKELLKDGDCIEIGAGRPTTWLPRVGLFNDFHDLGIHSEQSAWGQAELIRDGVFNGKKKTLHPGKAIFTGLQGVGWDGYLWMRNNPLVEMYDVEYVHNPTVIAQNENMVAINSIMQVDLIGQITCESQFGPRLINGPGGQIDFHLGAFMAKGGRAISMLRSLAFGGSSTIVPHLTEGTLVTIPRQFADYVVTEFGVAKLAGKSHRERAEELIAIAHPDFRAELRKEARKMYWP